MPLYELTCLECGSEFEELVAKPDAKVACPKCGAEKTKRKFSVFSSSAFSGKSSCGTCKPASAFS